MRRPASEWRALAGWLGQRYLKNVLLGLTYLGRSLVVAIYFMFPPTPATTILFGGPSGRMGRAPAVPAAG